MYIKTLKDNEYFILPLDEVTVFSEDIDFVQNKAFTIRRSLKDF